MIDLAVVWSIFVTGFALSWGPCLTNCTFIFLPYAVSTKGSVREALRAVVSFSAGRMASYVVLGALAGYSGRLISKLFYGSDFRMYVQIATASMLFLVGLTVLISGYTDNRLCSFIHRNDDAGMFLTGGLIGLLPCAPFFAILAIIIMKVNSPLSGGLLGLVFGAGTFLSPLFIIAAASVFMSKKLMISKRLMVGFQRICGLVIMAIAVFIFVAGALTEFRI